MYSTGHLLWIGISLLLIVGGYAACCYIRPTIEKLLKACLCVGIISETIKIFSVTSIFPVVEPKIQVQGETSVLRISNQH